MRSLKRLYLAAAQALANIARALANIAPALANIAPALANIALALARIARALANTPLALVNSARALGTRSLANTALALAYTALAGTTLALAGTALAADPAPRYNVIELQAEAQREVANDTLNANLYVELNDANPAALANAINKAANEALRVAKEYKSVRVRSGGNQTYPVYTKGNVLQGWRGRAEVRIESKDFEAASGLIGRLQAGMQLGSLSFSVSPEARRQTENELIVEAIGAYKARAEIVRGALAGRAYKIQHLNVNSGSSAPPPRFPMARAMAAAAPEVAAPNLEGGVSVVTVTAGGAIEVLD